MAAEDFDMVRVRRTTKMRLEALKGKKSFEGILNDMLNYFETTDIVPTSKIVSPVIAVQQQADRIIKVFRGSENTQNTQLKAIYEIVVNLSKQQITAPVVFDENEYIPVGAVQELLDKAKTLQDELNHEREEKSRLNTALEIMQKTNAGAPAQGGINKAKLLEIVQVLYEKKKVNAFSPSVYEIERTAFDGWIKRLNDEINKE